VRAREDPELFGQFFETSHEQVLAFFARRVLDPEAAFDLTAETFAAAFASLGDFRGTTAESAHAWLWAIARNRLYRWRERGVVERRALRELGIELPPITSVEHDRVEELADLERLRPLIDASLRVLPEDHRVAVHMRVIDDRSYSEMAAELGVSEVVARARVSRGLRKLAALLDASEDAEPELLAPDAVTRQADTSAHRRPRA
jgi:RNA polymerase sigma-70 factor (ECF subfamily)